MPEFEAKIFEKLTEIRVEQARQSEKQIAIHEDVSELKDDVKKQNGRVNKLENWRWYSIGLFTAIVGIVKLFWN